MFVLEEEEDEEQETSSARTGLIDRRIDELLLKQRRIFLSSAVDDNSARDIIRRLWYLEAVDPGKPILFVINSVGGSVDAGFAIWDQVQLLSSPVSTLVTGIAASMGSLLALVGEKGKRYATKHARIMIHQPRIFGFVRGQATDLEIQANEILKTRDAIIDIYHQATKKPKEVIAKALDRDMWMSVEEAVSFGLVDRVVNSFADIQ